MLAGALELLELREHECGVGDRVDSDVVAAPVRCPTAECHVDPDKAAMRRANGKARRFGDNRGISAHAALDQCAHTQTFVFLVRDRSNENLAGRR